MLEFIYTALLAALVAGGGVYIFYPDLKKVADRRPSKKAPQVASGTPEDAIRLYVAEIYEKHYSEEEELLEAHRMVKRYDYKDKSMDGALDRISARQHQLIEMITKSRIKDESISSKCVICGLFFYVERDGRVKSNCNCNENKFLAAKEAIGEQFRNSLVYKSSR